MVWYGNLQPSIISILEFYQEVFTKSPSAEKCTAFDPVSLLIIHWKPTARRALKCRPIQLYWKEPLGKMMDTLVASKIIEQVHKDACPYLSNPFLVTKPNDPNGPPRMVVEFLWPQTLL